VVSVRWPCGPRKARPSVEVPVDNINFNVTAIRQYAAIEIHQWRSAVLIEYTATGFRCGAIFLQTRT